MNATFLLKHLNQRSYLWKQILDGAVSIFTIWRSALFDWTDESSHAYSGGALPKINLLRDILLLEKAMAPHSRTLAWQIPWTEEPDGLQSMVSLRVGHDWVTSLSLFTFMHWRRKLQPTPVFLPGESQGWGSFSNQLNLSPEPQLRWYPCAFCFHLSPPFRN